MKNKIAYTVCLGLLALHVGACGDDGGNGVPGSGTLIIENASDFSIREVHVTQVNATTWGGNLIDGEILAPNESISVLAICDTYDVRISDGLGAECVLESIELCNGDPHWRITNDTLQSCGFIPVSSLTVTNNSLYTLYEVYVTREQSVSWGENLLGGDVLFPGESLTVTTDCDYYDVMVVDELGAECVLPGIDLCGNQASWEITNAILEGCDLSPYARLTVLNQSSYNIHEVYLTMTTSTDWGANLLGDFVLRPGESIEISDLTCDLYDVMVVDELGAECVLTGIDLCVGNGEWSVTDAELATCPFAFAPSTQPSDT